MNPPKDLADVVTGELLQLRQKVQTLLFEGTHPISDAHDAYVSALIGHLFAILLTRFGPGLAAVDKSPEALADALNIIARKLGAIAENLDPSADYKIQIFRREKDGPAGLP